jgi:dTDP-4-amino-4,6-dideoxygalactose transaminase
MPLTYHFRPFPDPEELRAEPKTQPTTNEPPSTTCPCQKAVARCKQCRQKERQERSSLSRSSQTILPSIKEELDPLQRALTPRAIREQRRAANRMSVSAALHEAVGSEDYFTLYHDGAFARSPAASPRSAYRNRRPEIASRKSSAEKMCLPSVPNLEASDSSDSVDSIESVAEGKEAVPRRDS